MVGIIKQKEAIKCTRFCHAEGKRDMIATVGVSGSVSICRIRYSVGNCTRFCHAIIRLGPLLSTDLLPIKENENILELPKWVFNQTIFISWEGPTLIQRCMMIGNQASIQQAALILKHYPDSIYSFAVQMIRVLILLFI